MAGAAILLTSASAYAHIEIPGPAFSGQNQVLTFNVGHGCEGADTVQVEITIPPEVTSVRGVPSFFGYADVKTNDAGVVTSVVFTKDTVRSVDDQYYQLALRITVPTTPFQTLYFPTVQTCQTTTGEQKTARWTITPSNPTEDGAEEAPHAVILPVRQPGWTKVTVPSEITDLTIFDDAAIVWAGDSAYSSNATTKAMIMSEPGVTPLTKIDANSEIWIKY